MSVRSFRFARTGTRIRIWAIASAGERRVSRSASAEIGCSIRFSVSRSRLTSRLYLAPSGGILGPVAVEPGVEAVRRQQLLVRSLFDDQAVLENDDQVGLANRRQPVRDDECRAAVQEPPQSDFDLALGADVDRARRL